MVSSSPSPAPSLNVAQQEAVNYMHGPCLVLAGAGSGKTRVITHKVGRLIQAGVDAKRIFAITVALVRSTVGTSRSKRPRKRISGSASSWISHGWPGVTLPRFDSETSASTSSVDMSAIVTTAACDPSAEETV